MRDSKCSKDSEKCSSIPPGECGPDCHGFEAEIFKVKVIDTFTGDSRVIYIGENRIKALNNYQEYKDSERFEVEFYKNGEFQFYS
jgi:hypothetical protein